jgi:hypothetical protein
MKTEDVLKNKTHTNERFVKEITSLVNSGVSYLDAIVHYAEKHNLEIETVASMVKSNSKIKSNLQSNAEDLNFLPKTSRLPV